MFRRTGILLWTISSDLDKLSCTMCRTAQDIVGDNTVWGIWDYYGGTYIFFRVPPNSSLFGGTVMPNSVLFGETVLPNSVLFGGMVPPNSFFPKYIRTITAELAMCLNLQSSL